MSNTFHMPDGIAWPTPEDVQRISELADPVIRNLQITQCYFELSRAMAHLLPGCCNWCTMATWASRQAGYSIRKQDLQRAFNRLLRESRDAEQAMVELAGEARMIQGEGPESLTGAISALWEALSPQGAFVRTSRAVAHGNLKVFAEIGKEFARFLALYRQKQPDSQAVKAFITNLQAGEPPEGQDYLRQAFTHYQQAMLADDEKTRAEWMFLANLEIGYHEQIRLQPEIVEAMNAPVYDPAALRHRLVQELFPGPDSWARFALARVMGRAQRLLDARDQLAEITQHLGREVITRFMMTLELPQGRTILLGRDIGGWFPPHLIHLNNPALIAILQRVDRTPDTLAATGAKDWSYFPDRMHFIADLFRRYQEEPSIFDQPFSDVETAAIKRGHRPADI